MRARIPAEAENEGGQIGSNGTFCKGIWRSFEQREFRKVSGVIAIVDGSLRYL